MAGVMMRVSQTQFPTRPVDDASIPLLTERLAQDQEPAPKPSPELAAKRAVAQTGREGMVTVQGPPTQPLPPLDFDVTLPPSVHLLEGELPVEPPASASLSPMPQAAAYVAAPEKGFSFAPPSFPLPGQAFLREVVTAAQVQQRAPAPGASESTPVAAEELVLIERRVQAAVMQALSEQLPQEVEGLVRQQVSAAFGAALRELVEPLVARLSEEAQNAIAASLRERVAKALEAELARFKEAR